MSIHCRAKDISWGLGLLFVPTAHDGRWTMPQAFRAKGL